jgi:hypothetical protein
MESVLARVAGGKLFSLIDLKNGFWQLPLDRSSSHLCTFNTPVGRYWFLRLPFGVSPAPEIFHRTVTETLEDLPGVQSYIDDILVWGRDKKEHDERVEAVMRRLQIAGFTINTDKSEFAKAEVKYLGYILKADGVRADPEKVRVLSEFDQPQTPEGLRSFLGAVTFVSKFIPRFAQLTSVLWDSLKSEAWVWTEAMSHAFQAL